jgi:hypothetical protein
MLRFGLLLLVLAQGQPQPKPLPDQQAFLTQLRNSLHTDDLLLSNYTYTEKRALTELDSNRKPQKTVVNIFEIFPGSCERPGYRRQIVKEGVRLTEAELEKQDREHQRQVQNGGGGGGDRGRGRRGAANNCNSESADEQIIDDLFGVYDIRIQGRETLAGKSTLVVTFNPRANYEPKTDQGKMLKNISGRAWVSEDDYQLARLDAEVIRDISLGFATFSTLSKGTRISTERKKINNEVWLPARIEYSMGARVMFKQYNYAEVIEYTDHKRLN